MQWAEPGANPAPREGITWVGRLFKAVEVLLSGLLAVMLVLVLGNVVLRYGFGTGITVSEELSRLLFIWVVFVGAVLAARERAHLNVDLLAQHLSLRGRWILAMLSEGFVVLCCVAVVWGMALQHDILATTQSLVMGYPMSLLYGVAYVAGTGMGLLSVERIVRLLQQGPASRLLEPSEAAQDVVKEAGV